MIILESQNNFYSHEPNEPPHIHVDRDNNSAKFWLDPVGLAGNFGFSSIEVGRILALVREHQHELLEAWHGVRLRFMPAKIIFYKEAMKAGKMKG